MKLINKKNFLPTVCIAYTAISLFKVIYELIFNQSFDHDQINFIRMFVISVIVTFILSLQYYLQKIPIWLVIIGQYLVLITFVTICLWIEGHFVELHPAAYKDMTVSITMPYIIGASVYYFKFLYEVKKANSILKDLKSNIRKDRYVK